MMEKELCAVVVTYNRLTLLKECIQGLLAQSTPLSKVIIVDNASTDGTAIYITESFRNDKRIHLIQMPVNSGGAGGFEAGIREAVATGASWVWVMDDDAEPRSNCLSLLLAAATDHPSAVAFAPAVIGLDKKLQLLHRGTLGKRLIPNLQEPVSPEVYEAGDIFNIAIASFVGLLIRTDAIREIGLPVGRFFIYNDDAEYSLRLGDVGQMLLVPSAVIEHKDKPRTDFRKFLGLMTYQYIPLEKFHLIYLNRRNLVWTIRHHFGLSLGVQYRLLVGFLNDALKILVLYDHKKRRLTCLVRAYLDGLGDRLGAPSESILRTLQRGPS